MSIILLQPYNGNSKGAQVDYDNATEAALVLQGLAKYAINPGPAYYPLTAAEQQALRDWVAAGGIASGLVSVTSGFPNSAENNTTAIQNAIAALSQNGGQISIIGGFGSIPFNKTIELPSNSALVVGAGTYLTKAGGTPAFRLIRNKSAQSPCYVNGLIVAAGAITIPEFGCNRSVGDQVYVEGMLTNLTLNGPKTITAVVPGVSFTYAATGANPTNTAVQQAFVSRYNPIAGASFTRLANVVTVQEAGHKRGAGDRLWVAGLGGANSFNGSVDIASVVAGVSWTYANTGANETATGTAQVLGDRMITVDYSLDGNAGGQSSVSQSGAHISEFGNVTGLTEIIRDSRNGLGGRVANHYNCTDVCVQYAKSSLNNSVLVQFDSYCDRIKGGDIFGQGLGDDAWAWGITSAAGPFADTAAPTGPGNMGTCDVNYVSANSPTGILKFYATTGFDAGNINIGSVSGIGPISIGDPSTGVSGGTVSSITLGKVRVTPASTGASAILAASGAFTTIGLLDVTDIADLATSSSTAPVILAASPTTTMKIEQLVSRVGRTSPIVTFGAAVGKAVCNFADITTGSGGIGFFAQSGTVGLLQLANISHNGGGGDLTVDESAGLFARIQVNQANVTGIRAMLRGQAGGATRDWFVTNTRIFGGNFGFEGLSSGTFNIYASNLDVTGLTTALNFATAGQTVRFKGSNVSSTAGAFFPVAGSASISVDCKQVVMDLGASAAAPPAQLVPLAGDQITNSNATGGGVYGRSKAGAWVLDY